MSGGLNILFVEDQELDAELCQHELRRAGIEFTSRRVYTKASFEEALDVHPPDVILSDFSMPTDIDGFIALAMARERVPDIPFIFVSGTIGEERAVEAMKAGATDYVLKDRLSKLAPVVKRALQEACDRKAKADAEDAMRESDARFRSFMEYLPGNAAICDSESRYTYVNEVWEQTFGLSAKDVLGKRYDAVPGAYSAQLMVDHEQVLKTNLPAERVTRTGDNGNSKWWLTHHFPIPAMGNRPGMIGTIAIDVTERTLQEEKIVRLSRIHSVLSGINSAIVRLRDKNQLLSETCRIAQEDGGFGIAWIGLIDGETGEATPAASAALDHDKDFDLSTIAIRGKPHGGGVVSRMLQTQRPEICNDMTLGLKAFSDRRKEAVKRGYRSVIALPLIVAGRAVAAFCLYSRELNAFNHDEIRLLMQLANDVSFALEYIENEQRLEYLTWHDPVTGLANRARLHDRLQYVIEAAARDRSSVAVLTWDIKRFRTINDTFGRDAGDALLRQFSLRFGQAWQRIHEPGRISADYFAGFIESVSHASEIANVLEAGYPVLAQPFTVHGNELILGVTVGIALYPTDGANAETLLANAEAALKQAKVRGERYMFYESAMNQRVAGKLTLESKLRGALDKDQFVLHYQPKVDVATGEVMGLEALIRWNDPQTGLVPPVSFIPLLEESGLILDVGSWAIGKALSDWKERTARGLPTPRVAVNVSPIQLQRPEFVDVVAKALGAQPGAHGLDLEITESLLMQDIESNIEKLRLLKEMGVNIAIDDFGTGYSSLSYLVQLPVDALKIDRSFILTMLDKPESMSIISTIISLAHALRLYVVAEGVESLEQAKLLHLLRCNQAQGFIFSKPLPWEECFKQQP